MMNGAKLLGSEASSAESDFLGLHLPGVHDIYASQK